MCFLSIGFCDMRITPFTSRGQGSSRDRGTWDLPFALLVLLTLCNNPALAQDFLGPDETGAANSQAQNAEVGESDRAEKNTFFFVSLGGPTVPAALNYERALGDWTLGGGLLILPVDMFTAIHVNIRGAYSLWPVGRDNLLVSGGGVIAGGRLHCHECGEWGETLYGLFVGVGYEHRAPFLFRLEFSAMWISDSRLKMVAPFGVPLLILPGVSIGTVF